MVGLGLLQLSSMLLALAGLALFGWCFSKSGSVCAGLQPAASGSAGITVASQSAWDICGTGAFRVGVFGVGISVYVCVINQFVVLDEVKIVCVCV